jgi:hypothetical protein
VVSSCEGEFTINETVAVIRSESEVGAEQYQ